MDIVVDRETGCEVWQGAVDRDGYPVGRMYRTVYEAVHGPIPKGLHIDHVYERGCCYRTCLNVDHMEAVTGKENFDRARKAGQKGHRTRAQRHMMLPIVAMPKPKVYAPAGGGWRDEEYEDDEDLPGMITQWLARSRA